MENAEETSVVAEQFPTIASIVSPEFLTLCAAQGIEDEEAFADWSGWRLIAEIGAKESDVVKMSPTGVLAVPYSMEAKTVKGYAEGQPLDGTDSSERYTIKKLTRGASGGAFVEDADGEGTQYNWTDLDAKFTKV